MLPDFRVGDEVTAAALNALLAELDSAERALKNTHNGSRLGRLVEEDLRVFPWAVQLAGDAVQVRTGRLIAGYGTDTSTNPVERGAEARMWEPFKGQDYIEVALPGGGELAVGVTVWLNVYGSVYDVQAVLPFFPKVTWWGNKVRAPELSAKIEFAAGGMRSFPLAVVSAGADEPVTQLLWGDLDVCGVWAVVGKDAFGREEPVAPRADLPKVWGLGCTHELCELDFKTDSETAQGTLRCCLDDMGGIEFFAGKLQGFLARPPSFPEPGDGDIIPIPSPSPSGDDPPGPWTPPGRRRRRKVVDPDGYIYEGGHGLKVYRDRRGGLPIGYDFTVTADPSVELVVTVELHYNVTVGVTTANSIGRYDWPWYGAKDLQMYYGVSSGGLNIAVQWRSSFLGADTLPKSASVTRSMPLVTGSCAPHLDGSFGLDSDTPPGSLGNIIRAVHVRDTVKRWRVPELDPMTGQRVMVLHERKFHVYRLVLDERKLLEVARNKCIEHAPLEADVTPGSVTGWCSNIDPPIVTVSSVRVTQTVQPSGETRITGPLEVSWGLEYTSAQSDITVKGSGDWNYTDPPGEQMEHGGIDEVLTVELPEQEIFVDS